MEDARQSNEISCTCREISFFKKMLQENTHYKHWQYSTVFLKLRSLTKIVDRNSK